MNNKYRRDGTPYPEGIEGLREWGQDFEDRSKKIVEQTELPNGKWVSTVWLGLDHQYGDGPPLIFETMVFTEKTDKGLGGEEDMERYSTEAEAIEGHKRMVEKWSRGETL